MKIHRRVEFTPFEIEIENENEFFIIYRAIREYKSGETMDKDTVQKLKEILISLDTMKPN